MFTSCEPFAGGRWVMQQHFISVGVLNKPIWLSSTPHMTTSHLLYIWAKTNQSQFWSHGDFDSILLMEPVSSSYSDTLQWKECFIDESAILYTTLGATAMRTRQV